jgi:FAD binding domain
MPFYFFIKVRRDTQGSAPGLRKKESKSVDDNGKDTAMTIDLQHVETLRTRLQGTVLLPGDEEYDRARQTWEAKTFDQHPALVVLPARVSDVQAAVVFARKQNLPIAMQGGGHGYPPEHRWEPRIWHRAR